MDSILERIDNNYKEIKKFRPFEDKNLLKQIRDFYRVEVTWSSNAIEGSSYTLSETKVLLEDGLTAGGKPLSHALAAKSHAEAWNYMFSLLQERFLSENSLLAMHRLLQGLENDAVSGSYRKEQVFITGSKHMPPHFKDIPVAVQNLVRNQEKLFVACHPVVAAAKFHKELAFIHPFSDGNGRIARLAMNCLLIQRGFLPVSIPPMLRHDYVESLERAHVNDADLIALVARAELETQKDFLRMLRQCGAEPHEAPAQAGTQAEADGPGW